MYCCHFLYCCRMNYLPNDFSFPVSLGIFGMKLPFKKHQLNLQTSTGPSWCLFPYYFSLCERILRRIRQRCRLVVIDVLHRNPNILKYLKQSLSVMSECNRSVMRIILLDQNVTVETSHLMNGKYANASERTQFQSTERPDKASSALLEGRVALIVDNSPMVLLLPVTLAC